MAQAILHLDPEARLHRLDLPDTIEPVWPGLAWGAFDAIGSPAYWSAQCWAWSLDDPDHYRLGGTLEEEVLCCLLGGYGIPAEVGLAAYERLRPHLTSAALRCEAFVLEALTEPLNVGGRTRRYRFARQKARFVSAAMRGLAEVATSVSDRALRDSLTNLPGIGPKTASWTVRNLRRSSEVAILDVHIVRVCRALGVFPDNLGPERHYCQLEGLFLNFADAINVAAAILDSVMWMTARKLPRSMLTPLVAP